MVQRKGGFRRKTRSKLQKHPRTRGKFSLTRALQTLKPGEKVLLQAEPSIHTGMFHPRFHGLSGEIVGKQGDCYYVKIIDGKKQKRLIVHPVHLKKQ